MFNCSFILLIVFVRSVRVCLSGDGLKIRSDTSPSHRISAVRTAKKQSTQGNT